MLTTASLQHVEGNDVRMLSEGWMAAASEPDAYSEPAGIDRLRWLTARVPGTAAGALRDAALDPADDLDAQDWWFRTSFSGAGEDGEQTMLHLDGIATVAEVYLNGERVLASESMFEAHAIDVSGRLADSNELAIRCRRSRHCCAGGESRARAGVRSSSPTVSCAGFARCCSAARPVLLPVRPLSVRGGPCGWSAAAVSRCPH